MTNTYFPDFDPQPEPVSSGATPPMDAGGVTLPFGHLDGRTFEVLAYRLLLASRRTASITLMKGVSDGGRDIVAYEKGELSAIVQCKNLDARLTKTALLQELVKLAVHAHIRPATIARGVEYELWAPAGFTEPCGELVDRWPNSWTPEIVGPQLASTLLEYAAFKGVDQGKCAAFVLGDFPKLVTPRKRDGIEISAMVRGNVDIYSSFFRGSVVARLDDVERMLKGVLGAADYRKIDDDDVKHLIDRLSSFPADVRLSFGMASVFGMSPACAASLTPDELKRFTSEVVLSVQAAGRNLHCCRATSPRGKARPATERDALARRIVEGNHQAHRYAQGIGSNHDMVVDIDSHQGRPLVCAGKGLAEIDVHRGDPE